MIKETTSGYEITIRGWVPASPDEPASVQEAMSRIERVQRIAEGIIGNVIVMSRYVHSRRERDLPADAPAQPDRPSSGEDISAFLDILETGTAGPGESLVAGADTESEAARGAIPKSESGRSPAGPSPAASDRTRLRRGVRKADRRRGRHDAL